MKSMNRQAVCHMYLFGVMAYVLVAQALRRAKALYGTLFEVITCVFLSLCLLITIAVGLRPIPPRGAIRGKSGPQMIEGETLHLPQMRLHGKDKRLSGWLRIGRRRNSAISANSSVTSHRNVRTSRLERSLASAINARSLQKHWLVWAMLK